MDVLSTNAWKDEGHIDVPKNSFFFGLRDLTSDYYQVMIEGERPRWCRIVWMVIITGLLAFTGFVVYLMVADYISAGSYDRIETITSNSSIILPSVTICSLNTLNYTAVKEKLKDANSQVLAEYIDLIVDAYWSDNFETELAADSYGALAEYEKTNGPLSYVFRNSARHLFTKYHHKYDYKFSGLGKTITNWLDESGVNELGECIELNDDSSLEQRLGGSSYGLTLDLDAGLLNYSPFTTCTGFRVFIKDHDETLFFNEGGTVIAPGTETFMQVTLNELTRLESPWGSCKNKPSSVSKYDGTMESRKECFQLAKAVAMYEYCNCIPWYIVHRLSFIGKTSLLDIMLKKPDDSGGGGGGRKRRDWDDSDVDYKDTYGDDAADWMDEYGSFDEYFVSGLNYSKYFCSSIQEAQCGITFPGMWNKTWSEKTNMCTDACSYNEYEVAVTSSAYPATEDFFNLFIKPEPKEGATETPVDETWEYAQKNLVRLHIFYRDIEYHTVAQTKDYEIQNFVGELGGVVDLFIGFSFFTIFQLLEIVVAYFIMLLCRNTKPDAEQTGSMAMSNNV